eukprot:SAG22_NODE_159_length_16948_cov_14.480503_7_plen_155_part_00
MISCADEKLPQSPKLLFVDSRDAIHSNSDGAAEFMYVFNQAIINNPGEGVLVVIGLTSADFTFDNTTAKVSPNSVVNEFQSFKATQNAWKSKPCRSNWTPKRTIDRSRLPPRYSWAKVGSLVLVTSDDKPCKCRIQKMDDENFSSQILTEVISL